MIATDAMGNGCSILQDYFGNTKSFELTSEHKELIDQRLEDYEKNPKNVISWEESKQKIPLLRPICHSNRSFPTSVFT
ncbi:MAG: addiction module protein [Bacteroidales bacterium]